MKKLIAISACVSLLVLSSCRNDQADEMFEETNPSGNVFLDGGDSTASTAKDSTAVGSIPDLNDNEPLIPPRK
ncbi:hypothetical protein J8J42_07885 [Chryseobacterium sp. cx-311]|uniref:hypothetical protein n=1 Tax=Marnyiella aurantia TaxID=2758037 RepID=UPI001AE61F25|nr:hypothetical protein [Marnyiella aurantia]MBP0612964.1 hypothetical protein [Marnyiella aurantia]